MAASKEKLLAFCAFLLGFLSVFAAILNVTNHRRTAYKASANTANGDEQDLNKIRQDWKNVYGDVHTSYLKMKSGVHA